MVKENELHFSNLDRSKTPTQVSIFNDKSNSGHLDPLKGELKKKLVQKKDSQTVYGQRFSKKTRLDRTCDLLHSVSQNLLASKHFAEFVVVTSLLKQVVRFSTLKESVIEHNILSGLPVMFEFLTIFIPQRDMTLIECFRCPQA